MDKLWDIVIVGGGLGGLSLAVELASPEFASLSILVLEKRKAYRRDRTWSYWTSQPHRYSHLERRRWRQWAVSSGSEIHTQSSQTRSYASLDADAFYREASRLIANASHITLHTNVDVRAIEPANASESLIFLAQGMPIRARTVFDARPDPHLASGTLVQQFVGWEVSLQDNVFDANQVKLMAFSPSPNGLNFMYVLPYSSRCALVESTWVSPLSYTPDYVTQLKRYMADTYPGAAYQITYREHGILSLDVARAPSRHAIALGRRGGTLRTSTGFAFLDTITHAAQVARSLSQALSAGKQGQWQPVVFKRSAVDGWMDAVFLQVLARDWQRAPDYFLHIFKSVAGDDTLDFLSGRATGLQRLRVMRSLPALPFMRAAFSRLLGSAW